MSSKGLKPQKSTKRKYSETSENFDAQKSKKPKLESSNSDQKHHTSQSGTLSKKERRIQAKFLTEARKKRRKPHYTLEQELATLWEKMRRSAIRKEDRSKLVSEALQKMKGKIPEIAGSHVSSRALQTCVKYCSEAEKEAVFKELQPHFLRLATNAYVVHLLKKMIDVASKRSWQLVYPASGDKWLISSVTWSDLLLWSMHTI